MKKRNACTVVLALLNGDLDWRMRTSWCVLVTSTLAIVAGTTVNAPKDARPPDALTTTMERNFQIDRAQDAGSRAVPSR